jgi:hypothetical protein
VGRSEVGDPREQETRVAAEGSFRKLETPAFSRVKLVP